MIEIGVYDVGEDCQGGEIFRFISASLFLPQFFFGAAALTR